MPGSAACFRCGADLAQADLAQKDQRIETYPPRAARSGYKESLKRKKPRSESRVRRIIDLSAFRDIFPYLARGFLSLVPGLCQFINGQMFKGFVFGGLTVITVLFLITGYNSTFFYPGLYFLVFLLFVSVLDGAIFAFSPETRRDLTPAHYLGMGGLVASGLFLIALFGFLIFGVFYSLFRVEQSLPIAGISAGETLIARKNAYASRSPRRGDCVVVGYQGRIMGVIVGLPGENITFDNDTVLVNGVALSESSFPLHPRISTGAPLHLSLRQDEYLVVLFLGNMMSTATRHKDQLSTKIVGVFDPPQKRRLLRIGS
jgi:hypothetical protein